MSVKRKVKQHPNATASGASGALAVCIVWAAQQAGLEMDAAIGAAFATVLTTTVLAVGRRF